MRSGPNSKRLRDEEVAERTKNWRLRNGELEGNLLDKQELTHALSQIFVAIKQIILASELSPREKKDILENIALIRLPSKTSPRSNEKSEYRSKTPTTIKRKKKSKIL